MRKGADMNITFDQVKTIYRKMKNNKDVENYKKCHLCGGTGYNKNIKEACHKCDGYGFIRK